MTVLGNDIASRPLVYNEARRRYELGGNPVSIEEVIRRDSDGELTWRDEQQRRWVIRQTTSRVSPKHAGPEGQDDSTQPSREGASAGRGIVALLFLALVAYFGYNLLFSSSSAEESSATSSPVVLQESHFEKGEYGTRFVVGTVQNTGSRALGYVQVEINLYDASGAQVGSTLDNVNNLGPGAVWKFKALVMEETATRYEVKGLSGF